MQRHMYPFPHERLQVFQVSLEMAALAKSVAERIPRGHRSLADQLLRASASVVLNIGEDHGWRRGRSWWYYSFLLPAFWSVTLSDDKPMSKPTLSLPGLIVWCVLHLVILFPLAHSTGYILMMLIGFVTSVAGDPVSKDTQILIWVVSTVVLSAGGLCHWAVFWLRTFRT